MKLIYLAAPYTHDDPLVREDRFNRINRAAVHIIQMGYFVFSPISHTHPIASAGKLPRGWGYWEKYDRRMLLNCDQVIVLMLDGWQQSIGVTNEIKIARDYHIDVKYMEDPTND